MFKEETSKMDLPKIGFRYPLLSAANAIIQFENNDAFLASKSSQKGSVFGFSFPFSHPKNSFKSHALFVTIMLRISELSGNKSQPYHYLNTPIQLAMQQEISVLNGLTVESMDKTLNFIPKSSNTQGKISITIHDEIERAGFYNVRCDGAIVKPFAINHNRAESILTYYTDKDLSLLISSAKSNAIKLFEINNTLSVAEIISKEKGKTLWWYFIFATLLFFFIEILLIRFLK
jgi:WD40 repeat protein